MKYDVAILGGGAAGLMSANLLNRSNLSSIIIEKNDILGRKILSTGNGRCNFSNKKQGVEFYNCDDPAFVASILNTFDADSLCSFFTDEKGVFIRSVDGYLYPYSNNAKTILNALTRNINSEIVTSAQVKEIKSLEDEYCITYTDLKNSKKITVNATYVICSLGGAAAPKLGCTGDAYYILKNLGILQKDVKPALVPLVCKAINNELSGIRAYGRIFIPDSDVGYTGEIQFNENTISGIPAFNVSGHLNAKTSSVYIDFFPDFTYELMHESICRLINDCHDKTLFEACNTLHNEAVLAYLLKRAGLFDKNASDITNEDDISTIIDVFKNCEFYIDKTYDFDRAQVTSGGVLCSQVNNNCESINNKNLYIVGETLDVDGICGGYNLHFAFASAKAAVDDITIGA